MRNVKTKTKCKFGELETVTEKRWNSNPKTYLAKRNWWNKKELVE